MKHIACTLLLAALILYGCSPAQQPVVPTQSTPPAEIPTSTLAPTATITPTATATIVPSPTATPKIPVLANTAVPQPAEVISPENVNQVIQLALWGGSAGLIDQRVAWSSDGVLAVSTQLGVYFYQSDSFETMNLVLSNVEPRSMALTADGSMLALGDSQGVVRLLDAKSGNLLRSLSAHSDVVEDLAFSPDGRMLASASRDQAFKLWDVGNGKELHTGTHSDWVQSIAFSPDGNLLATGSRDYTFKILNVTSGEVLRSEWTSGSVNDVAFSPEGGLFASANGDGIKLWDLQNWQELHTFPPRKEGIGPTSIWTTTFSPDGRLLASADAWGAITVWNVDARQELHTIMGAGATVFSLAFSPDGSRLASSGFDVPRIWDMESGQQVRTLEGDGTENTEDSGGIGEITDLAFSPDGRVLASADTDQQTLKFWDIESGSRSVFFSESPVDVPADDPSNQFGIPIQHLALMDRVAFSPDGRLFVAGGNNMANLWDVSSGEKLWTWPTERLGALGVAFSPDGRFVATAGKSAAHIWDVSTGEEVQTISTAPVETESVAFSPDGRLLALGTEKGGTRLADLETGKIVSTLDTGNRVYSVAFSPDGKLLASASAVEFYGPVRIKLWDVTSGKLLLDQSPGTVRSGWDSTGDVSFSPDGRLLASASGDATVNLWDVASGELLLALSGHTGMVSSVAFSPDGRWLVSGSKDGSIRFWGIKP